MRVVGTFAPAESPAPQSSNGPLDQGSVTARLDGQLYNFVELAGLLELEEEASTERVLVRAYARWGMGMLERLRGRFVCLVWDPATASGFLAVDHLGAGSLFVHQHGGRLSFASELRDLLAGLPRRPEPDQGSLVRWLVDGSVPRGSTLYAGVQRLQGGKALRLDRDGWAEVEYWAPRYEGVLRAPRAELAELLRDRITRAIELRSPVGQTAGTLLSGGLDSSSIAAVVHRFRHARAYSLLFPQHPSVDESVFITQFTQELDLPWTRVIFQRGGSLLRPALEFLQDWEWPSVSPALVSNLAVARAAAADGVGVLLDGEGGDELFGAPAYLLADALSKGRLLKARALAVQLAGLGENPPPRAVRWLLREYGLKGALPHSIHKLARRRAADHYSPPWLNDQAAQLLVAGDETWSWKRGPQGPRWWRQRVDQMTGWLERLGTHDYLRRKSAVAGVTGGHPFQDDVDLLEFVLRVPPEHAFDANLTRPLFRESMKGLVPDEIRLRRDKSTFNEFLEVSLEQSDRPALELLLGSPTTELRTYVNISAIQDWLREPPTLRPPGWAGLLWRLAAAEGWLRAQTDSSFPDHALETWNLDKPRYAVNRV
jgi:asparagine synthase (glutamine-hydrolysing)